MGSGGVWGGGTRGWRASLGRWVAAGSAPGPDWIGGGPSAPPRQHPPMSYDPLDAVQNDNIVNTWLHPAIKI